MSNYQVISKVDHAQLRWKSGTGFGFAKDDAIAPLGVLELPSAMMHLAIAFHQEGDRFTPAALQGLQQGKNLMVDRNGKWLAGYVPAIYRSYPFVFAEAADSHEVLCADFSSGLLSDSSDGKPLFDSLGEPTTALQEVLKFMANQKANREVTASICQQLHKHNLIQPWLIKVQSGNVELSVEGLFRIDEAALNGLGKEALSELRDAGALPVAYMQLLSMQHISQLGELANMNISPKSPYFPRNIDFGGLSDGGNITFGNI